MMTALLEGVQQQKSDNTERLKHVIEKWIEGGAFQYHTTWIGLRQVLIDSELGQLAENIKEACGKIANL